MKAIVRRLMMVVAAVLFLFVGVNESMGEGGGLEGCDCWSHPSYSQGCCDEEVDCPGQGLWCLVDAKYPGICYFQDVNCTYRWTFDGPCPNVMVECENGEVEN